MNTPRRDIPVSAAMISDYLSYITVGYFADRHLPPEDLAGYAVCADQIRSAAAQRGDLPWLALGLRHILLNPAIDAREFNEDGFAFPEGQLREIIGFLLTWIAPGAALGTPDAAAEVSLVAMSAQEWTLQRARLSPPSDSDRGAQA